MRKIQTIFARCIGLGAVLCLVLATVSPAKNPTSQIKGEVIQPSRVHQNEPFTFAVSGAAEGEVIQVKTADGTVVREARADRHGRIFLAAGLAAGSYFVGRATAPRHPAGTIDVRPTSPPYYAGGMQLENVPGAINLSEPLVVRGQGFSPDAGPMTVNGGRVLAATSQELVCPPLQSEPGMVELKVSNAATGESAVSQPVLAYRLDGRLERNKLLGGEQTSLRLQFQPVGVPARVEARVVEGPVSFEGGRRSVTTAIGNGEAILPLFASSTPGPFTIAWSCLSCAGDPETPKEWVQEKATDCATASRLTENTNNRDDLKKEAMTDDELANNKDYWDKDGQPNDKKKFKDFLIAEIQRLQKILRKEGEGKAKEKIGEAIDDAYKAGKAAGLKLE